MVLCSYPLERKGVESVSVDITSSVAARTGEQMGGAYGRTGSLIQGR